MRVEISTLFTLYKTSLTVNKKIQISDGLFIEKLDDEWLNEVKSQCPKIAAIEQLEALGRYSHRFFYEKQLHIPEEDILTEELPTEDIQLLLQAIVLSRIVKPTSIGYESVFVRSFHKNPKSIQHIGDCSLNNSNVAFVSHNELENTITESDIKKMSELWESFQLFISSCSSSPKYLRLRQAILFNEIAYSVFFADVSHTIIHSALEAIICAGSYYNKAQVTQRLPQLVTWIDEQKAEKIYEVCCELKHSAYPILKHSPSIQDIQSSNDQEAIDAVDSLRNAIREILIKALRDLKFADILADPQLLASTYKVYNGAKLVGV